MSEKLVGELENAAQAFKDACACMIPAASTILRSRMRAVAATCLVLGTTLALPLCTGCGGARAEAAEPVHAGELAAALSPEEAARVARGETVIRQQTLERGDRRYVGGVTYTVVDATTAEVIAVLDDVSSYKHVLPRTKRARLVGMDGGDMLVELVQGNTLYEATYTIRVRKSGH